MSSEVHEVRSSAELVFDALPGSLDGPFRRLLSRAGARKAGASEVVAKSGNARALCDALRRAWVRPREEAQ